MVNQGVKSELKSNSEELQKSDRGRKAISNCIRDYSEYSLYQNSCNRSVECRGYNRKKNIILFGLEENGDNASLVDTLDMVESVLFDIDVKPVLGSVVRLGQKVKRADQIKYRLKVQIPYIWF